MNDNQQTVHVTDKNYFMSIDVTKLIWTDKLIMVISYHFFLVFFSLRALLQIS